ncbi:GPW/gp25 family protein [Ruminiclostridium herbifermentans]|uniref:GPW/gp25 family protein n=1 Tax=Ruminiclostridium herbifermentans TaxID=2488810 RepID=A0A4U7JJ55_9FIRM|nr:GPW/gp25 family protein [Ruminiclostridium herbifermentans]QNU66043.1 GPW/gp25 family protein [Ruminiclostridium herbifermentans]
MDSYLGRGWKFPIQVNPNTGRILMSENEQDISEAITIILQTSKGERVMKSDFGCGLRRFVFDLTDEVTMRKIEEDIREAIMIWEPRVGDVDIKAHKDTEIPGKINIDINYTVRSTNNRYNMVYPFYLEEGSR